VSTTYVAKSKHKRPCDLCGCAIKIGDDVATWTWLGDEPPASSNIMRVHVSCEVVRLEHDIDEWTLGEAFDEEPMFSEARKALAAARADADS
jgi:hypothetical protein